MVVGGNFTTVTTVAAPNTNVARTHLFAFNISTGSLTSLATGLNGEVTDVESTGDGQSVWIAGGFSTVNGPTVRSLARININTGQRMTSFNPPAFDGRIHDMELRNGKLYLMGRFINVGNQPRSLLAAVDAATGTLDTSVGATFTEPRRDGVALDPVRGHQPGRHQARGDRQLHQGQRPDPVPDRGPRHRPHRDEPRELGQLGDHPLRRRLFELVPVVHARRRHLSGRQVLRGRHHRCLQHVMFLCDTIARWDLSRTGSSLLPEWTNYSGGDTFTAVAAAQNVIYVGGHQNYMNNPYIGDAIGAGAVRRDGLAALDPRSGATLSWDPSRERGVGVYGFEVTDTGLWIGSDTVHIGKQFENRARLAFMPLATGTDPSRRLGG